ncbi:PPE domain-containing protein [Actinopolyspora mortivallis]|uniref:PPE domain-containing protein n=1 Tax=Actinopolyspora mortivallis TaxID=33906 RepID=UPI00036DAEAC|nr:PPE domain-containing protein [Actinopolyspora mortivallis]
MGWNPISQIQHVTEEVARAGYDIYQGMTGDDTLAERSAEHQAAQAQAEAQRERAQLASQQRSLNVTEYDSPSIEGHDNWDTWSHERLHSFRDTLNTEEMSEKGRAVESLGQEISELFGDLESRCRAAVGEGWQGTSAEAAVAAARPVREWGESFGEAMRMTGLKIQELGSTAEQTKASIPPPPEASTTRKVLGGTATILSNGLYDDAQQREQERREAARQARAVVKNIYTPGYDEVDNSVPALPPPRDPLNPSSSGADPGSSSPATFGSSAGTVGVGGGISGSVGSGGFGGQPSAGHGGGNAPAGTAGGGVTGGNDAGTSPHVPNSPADSVSAWNTPPATGSGTSTTPPGAGKPGIGGYGAVSGPAPTPGVLVGGGASGSALPPGGGARPGPLPGQGLRAGVGGPNPAAPSPPPNAAGGQSPTRGVRTPLAGAGASGRGQDSEDEEHERPSWLVENEDVWLNDMPRTAPPVIGG